MYPNSIQYKSQMIQFIAKTMSIQHVFVIFLS